MSDELDAATAAALLGVKRATLYAYASRGLLHRRGSGRASYYLKEEVERLRARHDARSGHGPVAAAALRFGEPVLDTSITELTPQGPRYRGHDAVALARAGVEFERVAELLWTSRLPEEPWNAPPFELPRGLERWLEPNVSPLDRLALLLPLAARSAPQRHFAALGDELALARRLLATLFLHFAAGGADEGTPPSQRWLSSWGLTKKGVAAMQVALVLLADHELNASSFAARVAASTGADLFACLAAAVATVSGPRHGAASERVESFLDEAARASSLREGLEARARRGELIPGVGHPLYPEGDPRGRVLLELARQLGKGARPALAMAELLTARGMHPNVDFGTVAVCEGLGLPRGSSTLVFALGRSAGWMAHVLEQRRSSFVLRPRARFVPEVATS